MIGNVWEWCVNHQRIALTEFQTKTGAEFVEDHFYVMLPIVKDTEWLLEMAILAYRQVII